MSKWLFMMVLLFLPLVAGQSSDWVRPQYLNFYTYITGNSSSPWDNSSGVVSTNQDVAVNVDDLYVNTTTHRVGIGIRNPPEELTVYGAGIQRIQIQSTNNQASLRLLGPGGGQGFFYLNPSNRDFYFLSNDNLRFLPVRDNYFLGNNNYFMSPLYATEDIYLNGTDYKLDSVHGLVVGSNEKVFAYSGDTDASMRFMVGGVGGRASLTNTRGVETWNYQVIDQVMFILPRSNAPGSCVEGEIYTDDSGALCYCYTANSWEQINSNGSCV